MADRIRALLVDDDAAVSELTATYLRRVGDSISPTVETDPGAALDRLEREEFDCVVSDYDMPRMNGLEFLDAVRDVEPDLPFVLFTGKGSEEIASEAISAGVTDYLQKGTGTDQYEVLANRIENAVAQHRAERRAAEADRQVRRTFERITDGFFSLDDDWRFRYVNERAEQLLDRTEAELLGERVWEAFPKAVGTPFQTEYECAMETQEATTFEEYYAPLDTWFEVRAYPAEDGLSAYFRDVTERRRMGAELRETRRKIEALYDVAARAVSSTTPDEIYDLAVEAAENILEFDLCTVDAEADGVLVSRSVSKVVSTDGYYAETDVDAERNLAARAYREGETIMVGDLHEADAVPAESEYRSAMTVPLGEFGVFQAVSKEFDGFDDDDRELTELLATHLTEALRRIESEREVRAERDRFAALFENVPNAVVTCVYEDGRPVVQAVNPAFEETFGWGADEIVDESLDEYVVPSDRRSEADELNAQAQRGTYVDGLEVRRETTDGVRDFLLHTGPARSDPDEPTTEDVSVYTEITAQKERERTLARQNERLDEFASVVSHDLRNPLNVAQGRFEMLAEETESPHLDPLGRALDRMDALVADMLALTKGGEPVENAAAVELSAVAADAWATADTADARLRVADEVTLSAAAGRLRQLLENLFRNAVEHGGADATVTVGALGDASGGRCGGESGNGRTGPPGGDSSESPPEGFYVEDDGPGVPEGERGRIFDHGYSTAKNGTGFGLAIVADIAEAHGWTVEVGESESGGARFEIRT
ncbi:MULTISPECIES: PAS domain-containing protein [Halorussus]|uniref:PAS domain-containing protein n=1 Tax=Halorussus TaxID=1070314 RepID=UPI00209E73D7|nr:PAS domain-containing protein [Halorussus vallis]USZ75099.1 PAS domain-containing protein [Halorussus vallis]